jgi:hypothetical protein
MDLKKLNASYSNIFIVNQCLRLLIFYLAPVRRFAIITEMACPIPDCPFSIRITSFSKNYETTCSSLVGLDDGDGVRLLAVVEVEEVAMYLNGMIGSTDRWSLHTY